MIATALQGSMLVWRDDYCFFTWCVWLAALQVGVALYVCQVNALFTVSIECPFQKNVVSNAFRPACMSFHSIEGL